MSKGFDCIALLRDGDREGLACLYQLYSEDLYRYGYSICRDHEQVEESIHDFFVFLWEYKDKLGNIDNPKSYLFISFKRRLVKQLGKNKNADQLTEKHDTLLSEEDAESKIVAFENQEEYNQKLKAALEKLSAREREVIHLKYFEQYKNEEIAEMLEINHQSMRNLLYRAIQNLRKNI